jgi:hypothetical protein
MQDAGTSNHVYIRSEEYSWLPARVLEYKSNDEVVVSITYLPSGMEPTQTQQKQQQQQHQQVQKLKFIRSLSTSTTSTTSVSSVSHEGQTLTISLKDYPNQSLPLQNVNEEGILQEVEDMVDLSFLHEVGFTIIQLYNYSMLFDSMPRIQRRPLHLSIFLSFHTSQYHSLFISQQSSIIFKHVMLRENLILEQVILLWQSIPINGLWTYIPNKIEHSTPIHWYGIVIPIRMYLTTS